MNHYCIPCVLAAGRSRPHFLSDLPHAQIKGGGVLAIDVRGLHADGWWLVVRQARYFPRGPV